MLNADSLVGRVIDGFEIDQMLGTGGAGIVYLAHPIEEPERKVAIKVLAFPLQMTTQEQEQFRKRFIQEAQTLMQLHHPHILAVQALGEDATTGLMYMVMPYLNGGTLADRLAQEPLPLSEAIDYTKQLADALDYAHAHQVIHRDLKPANVLFDDEQQIFLADFGSAKLLDINTATLTNAYQIIGTPGYMAPEQISQEAMSPATDVYGLGILAYQMITGRLPFESVSLAGLLQQITQETPALPRELRPDLPVPAARVILRALAKEPEQRFSSAGAFARALDLGVQQKEFTPTPGWILDQAAMPSDNLEEPDAAPASWLAPQSKPKKPTTRRNIVLLSAGTLVALLLAALFASPHLGTHGTAVGGRPQATPTVGLGSIPATTLPATVAKPTATGGAAPATATPIVPDPTLLRDTTTGLAYRVNGGFKYPAPSSANAVTVSHHEIETISGADAQIAAVANTDGRLEIFKRGHDGALWHTAQLTAGNSSGWSGWASLGGSIASAPVAVVDASTNTLNVFAMESDGALHFIVRTGSGWSGWLPLGEPGAGPLISAPSVVVNSDGRLEVFVRGGDGALWHIFQLAAGGSWSNWGSLGGSIKGSPAVDIYPNGDPDVFALGADGATIFHIARTSSGWSQWVSLGTIPGGAARSDPIAVQIPGGGIYVCVHGAASNGFVCNFDNTEGGAWHTWGDNGGNLLGEPLIPTQNGVFTGQIALGQNHALWIIAPFPTWISLGGSFIGDPASAVNTDGRVEVFAVGADGRTVYHIWETAAGGPDVRERVEFGKWNGGFASFGAP